MKKDIQNKIKEASQLITEEKVVNVLKTCFDPEIPVNIYDLGLIYKIEVEEGNKIRIDMTLTSPACPVADMLVADVEKKVNGMDFVSEAKVTLVFDPPWTQELMSEEAKLELGFM